MAEKATTVSIQNPKPTEDYLAIGSLVAGVLSLCSSPLWCCGIPLGIVAVVLGFLGKKSETQSKLAMAGIILAAIAIVISICFAIWGLMNGSTDFYYDFDY